MIPISVLNTQRGNFVLLQVWQAGISLYAMKADCSNQFVRVTFCQTGYFDWEHVISGGGVEQTLFLWVHKEAAQHPTF